MQFLKRVIVMVVLAFVLIVGVLFAVQNTATAPLDLLVVQFSEQRVSLWVLSAFAVGGLAGMAISTISMVRLKSDSLLLKRQLKKRDAELDKLRKSDLLVPDSTGGESHSRTKAI